jgi:hypothetical protein
MNYLYHLMPRKPLVGNSLVPLNVLKDTDPALYNFYKQKYNGREQLLERRIPLLDCLWNDVVFLQAIPPQDLYGAYKLTGRTMFKRSFFQIDPATLDRSLTAVWFQTDQPPEGTCVPFQTGDLPDYAKIPEKTIEHYRSLATNERTGLMFAHVPHILFRGSIDISHTKLIEVDPS